jgi:geranylgeranylglycerol-phosphate geranylgeranyltransferase
MASKYTFGSKIVAKAIAVSDLVRTELPLTAGVCVVAGQALALGGLPPAGIAIAGFLAGFFISGSAMITNDYFDLEVDRVNHPSRPLPSGRISVRELAALTCIFTAAGLAAAALLGPLMLALAAVVWLVGITYNWKFKESGLPGNIMVAVSVAWTFVFGGISAGGLSSGLVWTFGALAFLFDLSEEIAGDAMDAKGDELRSVRSLARVRGRTFALGVSVALLALFILISFVPYMAGWLGTAYLALVLIADIAVCYFALGLYRSRTPAEGRKAMRRLYLTMTVFTAAFIVSRIL